MYVLGFRSPWFLGLRLFLNQSLDTSEQLILFSINVYNQCQCLDLISQPVLICNQSAQSTIKPVCKTCLVNMLKYKYHLGLSIRFVMIKTLHPIRMNSTNSPFLMMTKQLTIELGLGSCRVGFVFGLNLNGLKIPEPEPDLFNKRVEKPQPKPLKT